MGRPASPLYSLARGMDRGPHSIETTIGTPAIQSNEGFLTTSTVDLRSDTVTRPTPEMRRAMAAAEVGDDVFQDDPTVRCLEEETAALLGKEASVFVPSGCMGNEIAVLVHTEPGDEIVLDPHSHMVMVEAGAITQLMGRRFRPCQGDRGRVTWEDILGVIEDEASSPALAEVENTFNWTNGSVYPIDWLARIGDGARKLGLPVHLDGARLWNASAATGIAPSTYAACAESVMVCYSKGLGAPIGSALSGSTEFIREARAARKMFGGGMRQVGIIAAGALHALQYHRHRLPDDHRRARHLAEAIAETPGLHIDPREVETNIVIAEIEKPHDRIVAFVAAVEVGGVRIIPFGGPGRFRAVTHLDVDDAGIERAIAAIRGAAATVLGTKK